MIILLLWVKRKRVKTGLDLKVVYIFAIFGFFVGSVFI